MLRWIDDHHCVLDGTTFQLKDVGDPFCTDPFSQFVVLKPRWMIERYAALATDLPSPNVVEIGIFRGGSTALLALLLSPRKLVALEIDHEPAPDLSAFLERSARGDRVRAVYGVDQSDRPGLEGAVEREFGREDLDLVVDDGSHLLRPSTVSFNVLFPRLRPGGWYVLEDWSKEHALEEAITRSPQLLAELAANPNLRMPPVPMSRLVLEIVLGAASSSEIFARVEILQSWVAIQRGPARLDRATFDVRSTYGRLGRELLRSPEQDG